MTHPEALTLIDYIRRQAYTLNEWEYNFLLSIETMRPGLLSYKQTRAMEKIYEKSVGGGKYQKRQYVKK